MDKAAFEEHTLKATLAVGLAENRFRDAADAVEDFLVRGLKGVRQERAHFPIIHLVTRSVADLRAGQFLIGNGFLVQMASVIRAVPEALNLVELFVRDPQRAEAWLAGEKTPSPVEVRKELGEGPDPVYAWLAERSHPRLPGAEASAYISVDRTTVLTYMGGLPLHDPQVLLAATIPGDLLAQVAFAAGYVNLDKGVWREWPSLLRRVSELLLESSRAIYDFLEPEGEAKETADAIVATIEGVIANARELEEGVAQSDEGPPDDDQRG